MATTTEVRVSEFLKQVDAGEPPVVLLDVRNADEFESWKIEGRRPIDIVHIPYFDFIEDEHAAIARLPQTTRDIVVVCAKGGSSEMVADLLRGAGRPARNLIGGMIAYGQYLQPIRIPNTSGVPSHLEVWQFNRRGKGCLSYAILDHDEAIIVDPSRTIDAYETFLTMKGARLRHVLDTHVHADHVSGGPQLASRHGVPYSVSAGTGFEYRGHVDALKNGSELRVGETPVRAIETPGHTPGSMCYLVGEHYLLTGDTLFRKSVGRPDLGGHVTEWSEDLFETIHRRLEALPDSTLVLPAHYADTAEIGADGSVCASLGELRRSLPEFQIMSQADFTERMKAAVRTPPPAYAAIIQWNLGSGSGEDHVVEWELGKNQCAASLARQQSTGGG